MSATWLRSSGRCSSATCRPPCSSSGCTGPASLFGFEGHYLFSYPVYQFNPNQVAAFPSLHAGYPFLAFLFARRAFGRVGWVMLAYSACVWFAVVYLADHYVVDILGG